MLPRVRPCTHSCGLPCLVASLGPVFTALCGTCVGPNIGGCAFPWCLLLHPPFPNLSNEELCPFRRLSLFLPSLVSVLPPSTHTAVLRYNWHITCEFKMLGMVIRSRYVIRMITTIRSVPTFIVPRNYHFFVCGENI